MALVPIGQDPLTPQERAKWQLKRQVHIAVERVYGSWDAVYAALADGRTQLEIADDLFVSRSTFANQLRKQEGHRERMHEVQEARAEAYADEALVIAENADEESKAGISKAKLRVDVRKWLAAINDPKRYAGQRDAPTVNVNLTVNQLHLDALRKRSAPLGEPAPRVLTLASNRDNPEEDDE